MWDKMKLFGINVTFIIPGHIYFTVSANSTLKQSGASVVSIGINIRLDIQLRVAIIPATPIYGFQKTTDC